MPSHTDPDLGFPAHIAPQRARAACSISGEVQRSTYTIFADPARRGNDRWRSYRRSERRRPPRSRAGRACTYVCRRRSSHAKQIDGITGRRVRSCPRTRDSSAAPPIPKCRWGMLDIGARRSRSDDANPSRRQRQDRQFLDTASLLEPPIQGRRAPDVATHRGPKARRRLEVAPRR